MKKPIFKGVATALYTPITDDKIDFKALSNLIEEQIDNKISALLILGTTGESPTISRIERTEIIKFTVKQVNGRIPVITGCGSNSTLTAAKAVNEAKTLGADAALCVTPYYNKCNQEGLFRHYEEISKENLPIIVYNVPTRTGVNIEAKTMSKIADLDNVYGLKEANQDKKHIEKIIDVLKDKIAVYSGNDDLNTFFYKIGGAGAISVTSNIIPKKIADIYSNFRLFNNCEEEYVIKELNNALFIDVNPIPLKCILELTGKRGYELRLPLCKTQKTYEYLKQLLHKLRLI